MGILKAFYKDVRNLMREQKPDLKFVFHDAFRTDPNTWNDLFEDDDIENVIMDTHQYLAWWGANEDIGGYCDGYGNLMSNMSNFKYPVQVWGWGAD